MQEKIDWDTYFMAQCFLTSMRSPDPSTKHGAVIVDENKRILATGYNGPIAGIDDSTVPLTRPEKYPHLPHAEENALLSLGVVRLPKGRIYITGQPCHKCLRMILQKGIRHIVYGPQTSKMIDQAEKDACALMWEQTKPVYREYTRLDVLQAELEKLVARIGDFSQN